MADESGFEIGRAFVSVDPDAADFPQKLEEQVGGLTVSVRVVPDATDTDAQIHEQVGVPQITARVDADTSPAEASLDDLDAHIPRSTTFTVGADTSPATGELDALDAKLAALQGAGTEGAFGGLTQSITNMGHAADESAGELEELNEQLGTGARGDMYAGIAGDIGAVADQTKDVTAATDEMNGAVERAQEEYAVLLGEMGDLRTAAILDQFPDLNDFDQQLHTLGEDLGALAQPGAATEQALAGIQMRLTAAGEALDGFEEDLPAAAEGIAAFEQAAAAGASKNIAEQLEFTAQNMAGVGSTAETSAGQIDKMSESGGHATGIFHMFSQALGELVTNPFVWIAAATGGAILLGVELGHVTDQTDNLISALGRQNEAAGFNVQGYQHFSEALGENEKAIQADLQAGQNLATHQDLLGQALGHAEVMQRDYTGAQQAAATEADNLSGHLGTLEKAYGITQTQAGNLASAVHVSAKTLGESGDAANEAMAKIQAYANANVDARGPVGQMSQDMDVFGNDTLTATTRVDGLDQAFNTLVGNFAGAQQAELQTAQNFLALGQDAGTAGSSMSGTNEQSLALQQQFYSTIQSIEATANSMVKAGDSTQTVTSYIEDQTNKLSTYVGGNQAAQQALQGLQTWLQNVEGAANNQTGAIEKASEALANQFIVQVKNSGVASSTAKNDVDNLTTSIENTGTKSTATHAAREQLINDLIASGVQASTAKKDVDTFIAELAKIPKNVKTTVTVTGDGKWSVQQVASLSKPGGKLAGPTGTAKGWLVQGGTPHQDSVPIMAMPGELVVPEHMVSGGAVDHLKGKIPGFGLGGVVGGFSGTDVSEGKWAQNEWTLTDNAIVSSVEQAMVNTINSDVTAAKASQAKGGGASLHLSGSGATVEALMKSMAASVGWTGSQWTDLYNVEMREAGFNLNAQNPSSNAYGLAQFINGASEYAQYGGSAGTARGQITGMLNYIKDRYGTPSAAWQHELDYGWYDQGGELKPGLTLAMNNTGQSEHVVPPGGQRPVVVNFNGTQYPTPEQIAALKLELGAAVGVAG